MKKIVNGFVMNVPIVAPTRLPLSQKASGTERTSWKPNGTLQPTNMPIAQPRAMNSGGFFSRTIRA